MRLCMLLCHNCYIYKIWRRKSVGVLSHQGRGARHKEGVFSWRPLSYQKLPGELIPQLVYLNYLPILASFDVKRIMHYITFLLIKTSSAVDSLGKIKVWIRFSPFEHLLHPLFFYQFANDNWMSIWFS